MQSFLAFTFNLSGRRKGYHNLFRRVADTVEIVTDYFVQEIYKQNNRSGTRNLFFYVYLKLILPAFDEHVIKLINQFKAKDYYSIWKATSVNTCCSFITL